MADKKVEKKTPTETKAAKAAYVVVSEFRDRDDFSKTYAEGDEVSGFDAERLEDLVARKLVKKAE